MVQRIALLLFVCAFVVCLNSPPLALAQKYETEPQTATLVARRKVDGYDNYDLAAFNFKYGGNGPVTRRMTRNNWDILFGNYPDRDTFDVTMVVDDRSRIQDLGEHDWYDYFEVPALDAYRKPTREAAVDVVPGHVYLVHSKDTENDYYALFRVESLKPGESVTISWKLIPAPKSQLSFLF